MGGTEAMPPTEAIAAAYPANPGDLRTQEESDAETDLSNESDFEAEDMMALGTVDDADWELSRGGRWSWPKRRLYQTVQPC